MTHSDALCTSVTKHRTACDARRFGWSRFCWKHQPWPEMGLATVVALFVGVNAAWFIAVRSAQFTRGLAASFGAPAAQDFELPSLHDGERITIGTASYEHVSRDVVTLGDSDYEIERSPEGVFYLSGEIRDRSGRNVVAQLKDSRLFVSPGLGYDLNADSSALEVVDPESRPVLQFARDANGLVGWMGTYQKSGEVFLCGNPCTAVPEKEALPVLERQRRIFQYPGYLHRGVRER